MIPVFVSMRSMACLWDKSCRAACTCGMLAGSSWCPDGVWTQSNSARLMCGSLGQVVGAPTIFNGLWSMVQPLVDPVSRKKIQMLPCAPRKASA